jgi:hypothetical protein
MSISPAYAGLDLFAAGEYQSKKCALPYLENSSERNLHCHIWRTLVKELCTVTSGEYQ